MMPTRPPLCMWCSRFDRDSSCPPRCMSFPLGIPEEIFDAEISHLTSLNGEVTFDGTIPVGWEALAPKLDEPEGEDTSAEGWAPARRVD